PGGGRGARRAWVRGRRRHARVPAAVPGLPRQGRPPPRRGPRPAAHGPAVPGQESRGLRMTTALALPAVRRRHVPVLVTLGLFAAAFAAGALRYENFGTAQVFADLFIDNAFLLAVAIGMTFVILSGGIDLSVGAGGALSWMLCACGASRP